MSNKLKSEEENPQGLHRRYNVTKVSGEPVDQDAEYFVLRLDDGGDDEKHIEACRLAVIKYADTIEEHLPQLANDLYEKYGQYREVYCRVCGGCGISGCCPSHMCTNDVKGMYCDSYFNDLQEDRSHLDTWIWFMQKYHNEVYNDFYNRLDELEEEEKLDKQLERNRNTLAKKLNDEGDDYAR